LALSAAGIQPVLWDKFNGGFETLVVGSAPLFWLLTLLTTLSILILRRREPVLVRPFKVPFYPLPLILFAGTCIYMLHASLAYAGWLSLIGFAPAGLGLLTWFYVRES